MGVGMSSLEDTNIAADTGPDFRPGPFPASRGPHERCGLWLRIGPAGVMTLPVAGQPGHGRTASLRRQPGRIVAGRMEGGYADAFELICPSCGDRPYLDYSELPPQLQRLRGPHTLKAGLAAYDEHLGLLPRLHQDTAASPDAGDTERSATRASRAEISTGYRHEAFLYRGMAEFLTGAGSFIRRAATAGDPILVMVSGSKIGVLRQELGAEAQNVTFADVADIGRNPGRMIAAWRGYQDRS
jgi:MEDS: MEthanogen/methylotroph, DcmR Sensory domain